jgi:RNA polymerase II-associated factor 1
MKSKRRRQDLSQDDPTNIAKHILKGFNLAYPSDAYNGPDTADKLRGAEITTEDRQAWRVPKHPANSALHVIDSYPLLPDWDALPDSGVYMMYKFTRPPIEGAYDERLDVALLRPAGQSIADQERFLKEQAEYKEDPTLPTPAPRYHFEFFLPSEKEKVQGIKRNFTTYDPDNEDEIPFDMGNDDEGNPRKYFKYDHVRMYETTAQGGDLQDAYGDSVAIALHDPETHPDGPLRPGKLQKAAYFYPVGQTTRIAVNRPAKKEMVEEVPKVDIIETVARDPENEREARELVLKKYDVIDVGA